MYSFLAQRGVFGEGDGAQLSPGNPCPGREISNLAVDLACQLGWAAFVRQTHVKWSSESNEWSTLEPGASETSDSAIELKKIR